MKLGPAAAAALSLLAPLTVNAQTPSEGVAELPDAEPAAFDPVKVDIAERLRFEASVGVWLMEHASRLRTTNPTLSVGGTLRPARWMRLDGGYLFTWATVGTDELHVTNTLHALRARAHYVAPPLGAATFTLGGGPVGYLVTAATTARETSNTAVTFAYGLELSAGVETQVGDTLFRFAVDGASRGRRVDLRAGLSVGF